MRDERDACDSIMPMIRCLTNYLLETRGELMANLTVYRTSRLRRKSTTHLAAGSAYRIGMFVATSTRREAIQQLAGGRQLAIEEHAGIGEPGAGRKHRDCSLALGEDAA